MEECIRYTPKGLFLSLKSLGFKNIPTFDNALNTIRAKHNKLFFCISLFVILVNKNMK